MHMWHTALSHGYVFQAIGIREPGIGNRDTTVACRMLPVEHQRAGSRGRDDRWKIPGELFLTLAIQYVALGFAD